MSESTMQRGSPSSLSTPAFVGRAEELSRINEVLVRADRALVLIEGETGIGKTRLVQELLRTHVDVLVVACPAYSRSFTLAPVIDALRDTVGDVRRLSLTPLAGALRPLFPEWGPHLPPSPEALSDPAASQHRIFRALAELVDALAPGLLVVDDAHWADPATLDLLLFLASRPTAAHRIVLTYRPSELEATSNLHRLTGKAPTGTSMLRIGLASLGVDDTRQMVSSMLQERPVTGAFAEFLHARTEGVPLALEETVRLLHDRADLTRRDGEWVRRHLDRIEVPPTVRDGVLERYRRLGAEARGVLRAAATFGDAVDEATLVAMSGLSPDEVSKGLDEALTVLMLEVRGSQFRFRHVLVGQAVYDAISPSEARRGHRIAGEVLEQRERPPLARLAAHFRRAGDVPRWCRYAEQAAELASSSGDETTAVSLLLEVVLHAELLPAELARLADKITYSAAVGVERLHGLVATLRRAVDAGDVAPQVRGLLRFQLGRALSNAGDYVQSRNELELAIPDLADAETALRAMLMLGSPFGTDWSGSRHLEWLDRAQRVEPPVRRSDRTRVLVDRVTALLGLGQPSGWDEAAHLPDDTADAQERDHLVRGHVNLSDVAMLWGRFDVAGRSLARAEHLARGGGYPRVDDLLMLNRARFDWLTGTWDGLAARVEHLADNEDIPPHTRLEPLVVAIGLQFASAPEGTARPRLEHAWELARQFPLEPITIEAGSLLALRHLIAGRLDDALRVSSDALAMVRLKQLWLWASELAPVRVAALLAGGDAKAARSLTVECERGIRGRGIPAAEAGLATCKAMLAERDDDVALAGAAYQRAVDAWSRMPRPHPALLVRERWARHELAVGATEPGIARLSAVFDGLADLGARADATRVLETLAEHGVERSRPWWGGRTGYGANLSPREREVVRLVAQGRTNREVAEALFRSPHTVSTQLSSAMRKLGVSSRRDLVVPD
ncbi:helix-turn-helix transcriptional regulator [Nocardioides sp. Soil796]|uniref:helix-turn-helix transcriptional regulator n=1 Tax=Nocardioides sp. Soil796 TaxID=1736412 RepID=UPI00138F724B|nr:AAA family ATPase [Nocardioides sp. Soil796]